MFTAIALGLLIEWLAYVNYHPTPRIDLFVPVTHSPNLVDTIVEGKLQAAARQGEPVDVLVLGDSSGLMGVDPRIIREQTTLSAYNLCTVSWLGVEGNRVLLDQFIATHGQPSIIIYHFAPSELRYDADSLKDMDYVRRVKLWVKLNESIQNPDASVQHRPELSFADQLFLPTQSYRTRVQASLQLRTAETRHLDRDRGSRGSHRDLLKLFESQHGFLAEIDVTDWSAAPEILAGISDHHKTMFQALITETQRRNIQLILVANPVPEVARTPENERRLHELETALVELTRGQPNVRLLLPLTRYYPNGQMAIQNHVAASAVDKNTREILQLFPAK
jgi:hypothetical protein